MQSTHNTLSENIRAYSVELLNKHLAAAIDLHVQVKQTHWNVCGPSFIAIHGLFDKVSSEVENYSDLIAERAGGLGGTTYGTVQVAAERSFLVPYPLDIADEQEHVFVVSGTLAAFGQSAWSSIKRRPVGVLIPPIYSLNSHSASTISYGSSNRTSRQKRAERRCLEIRLGRDDGSEVTFYDNAHFLPAVHFGPCVPRRVGTARAHRDGGE